MSYLIDGGSHIDGPLGNIAVKAFTGEGSMIAGALFPTVRVAKQSDGYYILDPDVWLRQPNTLRAPKTGAKMGDWQVSTTTYFAHNYAFGTENALEALSNHDVAVQLRRNSTMYVVEALRRDKELRVANQVTSVSNVGSGVILSGGNLWSDPVNSKPISDITTGHAFIRSRTGLRANTAAMDADTFEILRQHPEIRDYAKHTIAGPVPTSVMLDVMGVQRILVADGIYNSAKEGATGVRANIWGNNCLLARVEPGAAGLQTATFGLTLGWQPEGFPAPFVVERYNHHDRSRKSEVIEAQYFADEKIVATDLAYLINTTL